MPGPAPVVALMIISGLLCRTLAAIHAINPRLVYEGAKKTGLTYKDVAKLGADDPVGLGDLMFV